MKNVWIVIFLVLILSACRTDDTEIHISSRELFDEDNEIAKVHFDGLSSEYIEVDYSGDMTYDLEFQLWLDGELQFSRKKMIGLELSEYNGFSILVDESDGGIEVEIGTYRPDGNGMISFTTELSVDDQLLGKVESNYIDSVTFNEDEEVILWGYHKFENILKMFEDPKEAIEELEWSLVFVLTPSIEQGGTGD